MSEFACKRCGENPGLDTALAGWCVDCLADDILGEALGEGVGEVERLRAATRRKMSQAWGEGYTAGHATAMLRLAVPRATNPYQVFVEPDVVLAGLTEEPDPAPGEGVGE